MRSSNLKKKFPSLVGSVLVIAAFALLGSMMLPSISEKMGLDEGFCLASVYEDNTGYYEDPCGYFPPPIAMEDCNDAYDDCVRDCRRTDIAYRREILRYCERKYPNDAEACLECYIDGAAKGLKALQIALDKCLDEFSDCLDSIVSTSTTQ